MVRFGFPFLVLGAGCQLVFDVNVADAPLADAPDPIPNRVFVTSTLHDGAFGGLDGADAICQAAADGAGLGGTYVAWLSTSSTNAFDRIADSSGWARVDGEPVAISAGELVLKGPLVPILLTESGEDVRGAASAESAVWSGTLLTGAVSSGLNCQDWTINTATDATTGLAPHGGAEFTDTDPRTLRTCDMPARLYCFEVGKQFDLDIPPLSGPIAFLSSETWAPSDINVADAMCAADAVAANRPGTFLAALAELGEPMTARFTSPERAYVRVDGISVGAILVDPTPDGFINVTVDGRTLTADGESLALSQVWTGGLPSIAGTASRTCANWTQAVTGFIGRVGTANGSDAEMFEAFDGGNCQFKRHVYCLEN